MYTMLCTYYHTTTVHHMSMHTIVPYDDTIYAIMSMYRYHHIMVSVYVYDACVCIHHVQNTDYTDVWYSV